MKLNSENEIYSEDEEDSEDKEIYDEKSKHIGKFEYSRKDFQMLRSAIETKNRDCKLDCVNRKR
jgi:hypothetical protein